MAVHEDPRTGRPAAYAADWNRGMRVLDVSEPTDIEHVGRVDASQVTAAVPFPALVETADGRTKRVAVTTHEEYDERFDQRDDRNFTNTHEDEANPDLTGTVLLVDCDGIYPGDPGYDGDGPARLGQLDGWTWANVDTDAGVEFEDITFERRHLSPHGASVVTHETDGERRLLVQQGHRHGGVRYLEVRAGSDDGLVGDARRDRRVNPDPAVDREEPIGWLRHETDWSLVDIGHARPRNGGTDGLTPRVSTTDAADGVTFACDRRAGAYATRHEAVTPTPALPTVEADRTRVPDAWTVLKGDVETYTRGVRTAVELEADIGPGTGGTFEHVVETPDDGLTRGTFGPVEVSADGETWVEIGSTVTTSSPVRRCESPGVGTSTPLSTDATRQALVAGPPRDSRSRSPV